MYLSETRFSIPSVDWIHQKGLKIRQNIYFSLLKLEIIVPDPAVQNLLYNMIVSVPIK